MNTGWVGRVRLSIVIAALLLIGGCHKKYVAIAPLAPPPPPVPTATFSASPSQVRPGEAVRLEWSTQYATYVSIYPLGEVDFRGSRSVVPSGSTVYTLTALGPGGTYQSTLEVTVIGQPPAEQAEAATERETSLLEEFDRNVKDIFFDYNRYDLRAADTEVLRADADFLAAHPKLRILIAGHCDERGSREYNVELGWKRANRVRDELEKLGISADRMKTVSYGKERPFCAGHGEECRQQNRRAHFSLER